MTDCVFGYAENCQPLAAHGIEIVRDKLEFTDLKHPPSVPVHYALMFGSGFLDESEISVLKKANTNLEEAVVFRIRASQDESRFVIFDPQRIYTQIDSERIYFFVNATCDFFKKLNSKKVAFFFMDGTAPFEYFHIIECSFSEARPEIIKFFKKSQTDYAPVMISIDL